MVDREEEGECEIEGEEESKVEGEVEGVSDAVLHPVGVKVPEVDGEELWDSNEEGLPTVEALGAKLGVKDPLGDPENVREGVGVELCVMAKPEGDVEMEGVVLRVEDTEVLGEDVDAVEGDVEEEEVRDGVKLGVPVGVMEPVKVLANREAVKRPPEGVERREEAVGCPDSVTEIEGEGESDGEEVALVDLDHCPVGVVVPLCDDVVHGLPVSTFDMEWGGELVALRDVVPDAHKETEEEGDPVVDEDREEVREGVVKGVMEGEVEGEGEVVLEVEGVTVVVRVGVMVMVMEGDEDMVVSGEGEGEWEASTVEEGRVVEVSVVEPESDAEGDKVGITDTLPVGVPKEDSVRELEAQ